MMRAAMADFAAGELRPAAQAADAACAAPGGLLAQSAELGLATLGVPEELDGAPASAPRSPACLSPRRSPTATWASRPPRSRPPG